MTESIKTLISNAQIIDGSGSEPYLGNIILKDEIIEKVEESTTNSYKEEAFDSVIDASGLTVMPGLIDAHCHIAFDEPSSNDELFYHRREGLAAIIAGQNALRYCSRELLVY